MTAARAAELSEKDQILAIRFAMLASDAPLSYSS